MSYSYSGTSLVGMIAGAERKYCGMFLDERLYALFSTGMRMVMGKVVCYLLYVSFG